MEQQLIHHPDNFQTMPWRNGLGYTIELLSEKPAQSEQFNWRLSMADVTTDGEFSDFSGYDRTLILLEGKGLTLDYDCGGSDKLTEHLQAAHFKGDEKTIATLHDGPIKDFNIMSKRGYCTTSTTVLKNVADKEMNIDCDILLIYAAEESIELKPETRQTITVGSRNLFQFNKPQQQKWAFSGSAMIIIQLRYL